jgi:putative PIN family toxin of toxin-antitoxin system
LSALAVRAGSVVLDTNIVLDLLVFDDPGRAQLAAALDAGELCWIATAAMRGEFERVLGYSLIVERLTAQGRDASEVLAAFDARAQVVDGTPARAPCICSDPDDQMFIDLAVAHRARLVSKDRAVLSMRKRLAALGVEVAGA